MPWAVRKKITQAIVDQKADYVIQVKDNQQTLHEDIALYFKDPVHEHIDFFQTVDGDHGRIETRQYTTTPDIGWLYGKEQWAGIQTIVMATRQREVNGKISIEKSYFISSLPNKASVIANSIRRLELSI